MLANSHIPANCYCRTNSTLQSNMSELNDELAHLVDTSQSPRVPLATHNAPGVASARTEKVPKTSVSEGSSLDSSVLE